MPVLPYLQLLFLLETTCEILSKFLLAVYVKLGRLVTKRSNIKSSGRGSNTTSIGISWMMMVSCTSIRAPQGSHLREGEIDDDQEKHECFVLYEWT